MYYSKDLMKEIIIEAFIAGAKTKKTLSANLRELADDYFYQNIEKKIA